MRIKNKWVGAVALIGVTALLTYALRVYAAETILTQKDNLIEQIRQMIYTIAPPQEKEVRTPTREDWINDILPKLEWAESQGNESAVNWQDARKTGFPSRGCLQFQPGTFTSSAWKYGVFPNAERVELPNLYLDCSSQRLVARAILTNEPTGWEHWHNSFVNSKIPKTYEEWLSRIN